MITYDLISDGTDWLWDIYQSYITKPNETLYDHI